MAKPTEQAQADDADSKRDDCKKCGGWSVVVKKYWDGEQFYYVINGCDSRKHRRRVNVR